MHGNFVLYEEEFQRISAVCERLTREANAKVVFLGDKNGQLIACTGQTETLDTTSLASLMAGQIDHDSFTVEADTLDDAPDLDAVIITINTREWE